MAEHYVYKYVKDGKVIYVGKTNRSLKARIDAHAKEEKFVPYFPCEIWISAFNNAAQVNGWESLLIDAYQPVLNITDKFGGEPNQEIDRLLWMPYNTYLDECIAKSTSRDKRESRERQRVSLIKHYQEKWEGQVEHCQKQIADHEYMRKFFECDIIDWTHEQQFTFCVHICPLMMGFFRYMKVGYNSMFSHCVVNEDNTDTVLYHPYDPRLPMTTRDAWLADYHRRHDELEYQLQRALAKVEEFKVKVQIAEENYEKQYE